VSFCVPFLHLHSSRSGRGAGRRRWSSWGPARPTPTAVAMTRRRIFTVDIFPSFEPRYIGLDAHASSCSLGVMTPSGKRVGSHVVNVLESVNAEAVGAWLIHPWRGPRISGGVGHGLSCPKPFLFPFRAPMVGLLRSTGASLRRCRLSPPPPYRNIALPRGPASSGDLPRRGAGRRPDGLGRPPVGGAPLPRLLAVRHPCPRVRARALHGLRARPAPGLLLPRAAACVRPATPDAWPRWRPT
jgi:hypothetical protein